MYVVIYWHITRQQNTHWQSNIPYDWYTVTYAIQRKGRHYRYVHYVSMQISSSLTPLKIQFIFTRRAFSLLPQQECTKETLSLKTKQRGHIIPSSGLIYFYFYDPFSLNCNIICGKPLPHHGKNTSPHRPVVGTERPPLLNGNFLVCADIRFHIAGNILSDNSEDIWNPFLIRCSWSKTHVTLNDCESSGVCQIRKRTKSSAKYMS